MKSNVGSDGGSVRVSVKSVHMAYVWVWVCVCVHVSFYVFSTMCRHIGKSPVISSISLRRWERPASPCWDKFRWWTLQSESGALGPKDRPRALPGCGYPERDGGFSEGTKECGNLVYVRKRIRGHHNIWFYPNSVGSHSPVKSLRVINRKQQNSRTNISRKILQVEGLIPPGYQSRLERIGMECLLRSSWGAHTWGRSETGGKSLRKLEVLACYFSLAMT